ncbi:MAG: tRNA lysidine(34) synthetase TilS [Gammaproteobacteria bacterium]|nr:tRNA lysidine(34) synthetase TilS [Gammaproteobacteria bacterium]
MENSKNSETPVSSERRFSIDALAAVLTVDLALTPDVPLYVAYSGGLDSHVLLHALAAWRAQAPWRVHALHVDHGLQPMSIAWARHCAAVCAALGVPYQSDRVQVQRIDELGLEDAARRARYTVLADRLPAGAVLLTAHHQDDQAETVLLQLLRGAGVHGLAAMPVSVAFAGGRLLRPLLGFRRAALAEYAAAHGLHWVEDMSNVDTRFARNFVRQRLSPVLTERWPQSVERIARSARYHAEAAELLDELACADLDHASDNAGELKISAVQSLSAARQSNLLRYWIRAQQLDVPSEPVLQQILRHVRHCPETRHAIVCWRGAEVRRYRDRLVLMAPTSAPPADWQALWQPSEPLAIADTGWYLRARSTVGEGLARACLAGKTVRVQLRRGGEHCQLRGHRHELRKLLQEAGVPPWERARLPLIYLGDDLAAIGDRWICEPFNARAGEPGFALVLEQIV